MPIPTDIQEVFIETWEKDQADPNNDILPSDLGHPDWDFAYLDGHDWAIMDGKYLFFD